ncbi:mannose-6-phosphate receptor binding domain-containing protein [Bombardia bombarda]|uniref:Mannose-6-phosphate receptor binding domain-containing protein n=1 Tax=Bombardia bombarda TaxID=252184 RepID=A0AA40CA86_9PEZI|nr:mannose-6-phosphate receptor binding domain-containing protein [Bombardia bombarda]
MHPQTPRGLLVAALIAMASVVYADDKEPTKSTQTTTAVITSCVATSTSGAFYDLRPDMAVAVVEGAKPLKGAPTADYLARGYDYGSNFTLNICGSVVKTVEDVVGLDKAAWKNVSAYYESKGKVYSLGQESGTLTPRGRKLVLRYAGGSPCGTSDSKNADKRAGSSVHEGATYRDYDEDDEYDRQHNTKFKDDDKEKDKEKGKDSDKDKNKGKDKDSAARRKSTVISFLCDRDADTPTTASFVGTDPDECAYFFEVRSQHACAGAEPHTPGSVGPGSVFAIIFFIAVLVYIFGGIFYQRTVMHARGWRQLPNYSMWAGMWSFIKDFFIILTSSCARFLPSRRGYRSLSISPNGRSRNREDENRLIDQLDEEWDD